MPGFTATRIVGIMQDQIGSGIQSRRVTSVRPLRHDRMGQGPTEPHAGRGTFLLSSGGAWGGYY